MVTGGDSRLDQKIVRSTEIQRTRSSSWEIVAEYPIAVKGLSGATINNIIYMSGGKTRQCHVVQF